MRSRIGLFCGLLFVTMGCRNKGTLVKEDNIDTIKIANSLFDTVAVKSITDPEKILYIAHALNNADVEPRYFKPSLILTLIYSDKHKTTIMCMDKYIKVNGLSYVINKPIKDLID